MTTSADSLLEDLARQGVKLWVEGPRLRYSSSRGPLSAELLAKLRENKTELLARLQGAVDRTFPPSFAQRRFYALQKMNPADAFYNVPFVFRLSGDLDVAILRASFNEIVKRHEVLRTTLEERGGELVQVVAPEGEINLTVEDLTVPLHDSLRTETRRPFDLARQPGLRVLLMRHAPAEYYLQLTLHNTLFDQSSLMVLLKELSEHYAALLNGQSASLPPPAQYADYARWQESFIASNMEGRLKYWREWHSRGEPPSWQWGPSKSTPRTPGFGAYAVWQRYSPELTSKLKALARSSGGTIYLTLLTVYAIILSRYTGCDDVTLGTTYSNRHPSRFASLIGATIDVPALRVDMTDNPTVLGLLARTRVVVAEALTWQDVPFEYIAPRLERKAAGPLFRMVFSFFGEVPHGRLRLFGVDVEFLEEFINDISRPDLYLVFWENQTGAGEALTGYWMHKQDVFELETAEKMNREFQTLISAIVEDPTQRVRSLLSNLQ
jgi:hypothetical protein